MALKLLIVEDEQIIRKGIVDSLILSTIGVDQVEQASTGYEGLQKALKFCPDIILTDIKMPGMDGIEMVSEIRKTQENARVVFLTGYSDFEYARSAIRLGVDDYLLKPIDVDLLNKTLTSVASKITGAKEEEPSGESEERSTYSALVKTAMNYVCDNIRENLQVQTIASDIHVSPNYLSHVFKDETGENLIRYISKQKIEEAKKLLIKYPDMKTYEIASCLGFSDYKYFIYIFKKYAGATPADYREKNI